MQKKKVLIVDDHPIVRDGLKALIQTADNFSVCGESGTLRGAVGKIRNLNPDILLLDLFFGDRLANDFIKNLRLEKPGLPILVVTMQKESIFAERALRAGANGYLIKEEASDMVLLAMKMLLEKKCFISEKVYVQMARRVAGKEKSSKISVLDKLSDRELQIFKMIGGGESLKKIAMELDLSIKTVETVCARIKKKFNLQDANELVRFATLWHSEI